MPEGPTASHRCFFCLYRDSELTVLYRITGIQWNDQAAYVRICCGFCESLPLSLHALRCIVGILNECSHGFNIRGGRGGAEELNGNFVRGILVLNSYKEQIPLFKLQGSCPGLNTNGSNITITTVLDAIQGTYLTIAFADCKSNELTVTCLVGFNFQPIGTLVTAAKVALLTTDNVDNFSLEELALHGTLEHDVSLSRNDLAVGDNIHFNATVFATLNNSNPEDSLINPDLTNTIKEFTVRLIESAFLSSVIGNVTTGVAPKNFIQMFFEQERLPMEEGWHRSEVPIEDDNFNLLIQGIGEAVHRWAPSGPIVCPWIRLQPEGEVSIVPIVVGTE
ncbi:hypothetical protein BDP27DRAFT_1370717 [Rhodocollybia butyracea]|uniref:Heme haloperoxidase family profile domain-containing protein n=1 Tax=Rhodocollybia butyracea TaxID=206335 RepID=A0A9P5P8I6_9AGAR|nr:hypothetical protein BDP27DRAFT_1370717 [Rhodocollybia butyracea]